MPTTMTIQREARTGHATCVHCESDNPAHAYYLEVRSTKGYIIRYGLHYACDTPQCRSAVLDHIADMMAN